MIGQFCNQRPRSVGEIVGLWQKAPHNYSRQAHILVNVVSLEWSLESKMIMLERIMHP